ncbi:MAG: PorP/SprF family type IX secretion system membrane protein [Cytophagales bacterium]
MRKLLLLIITFCVLNLVSKAQDATFSQYYASSVFLNPALVGNYESLTFNSSFRSQWQSIVEPYTTSQISLIAPLKGGRYHKTKIGGIGATVFNDVAGNGNFKTTGIMGSFAYNKSLDRKNLKVLSFGGQVGLIQKQVDFSNLEWGSQYNPFVGFDGTVNPNEVGFDNQIMYPNVNLGFMFYYNPTQTYLFTGMSSYSGVVVSNVIQPNESFIKDTKSALPLLIKYHGGFEVHMSSKVDISPNILVQYQDRNYQINGGLYVTYRLFNTPLGVLAKTDLVFGGWYRYGDAAILSIGLDNRYYTIGFSYDYNTSQLSTLATGTGAYEITLTLRKVKEARRRRFSTPKI